MIHILDLNHSSKCLDESKRKRIVLIFDFYPPHSVKLKITQYCFIFPYIESFKITVIKKSEKPVKKYSYFPDPLSILSYL